MPVSNKVIIRSSFLIFLGVFLLHFSMTILHVLPDNYISSRTESYSHLWCFPIFHQGWALFAPEPQSKHKRMEMRYASEDVWTDWMRAERICMDEHIKYRVTHYSKLCQTTQNTIYFLWQDTDIFSNQEKDAIDFYPASMGYIMSCEYAKNQSYHFLDELAFDSLQIRLILEDPFEKKEPEVFDYPTFIPDEE